MSPEASLDPVERQALLDEVTWYLPIFLARDSTEQQDPAGDVRALLQLAEDDRERVLAVHLCLDPAVRELGEALARGLTDPHTGGPQVRATRQHVSGGIDWAATGKRRTQAPGEVSFVVREPGAALDTPENRALVWLLDRLESAVDAATHWRATGPDPASDLDWWQKIDLLHVQLTQARTASWLRGIPAERPDVQVLVALRGSIRPFYAERLAPAAEAGLRLDNPTPEAIAEILARRFFRPTRDSVLFEVAVALRLAKAFHERSPHSRRTRLLIGEGKAGFARYELDDGSEVRLAYQAWPWQGEGMRRKVGNRHGIEVGNGFPDLFIVREGGEDDDAVILELKASRKPSTLRGGLQELLAYLGDRPEIWGGKPAGWLVAPASDAFEAAAPDPLLSLWIVSADGVAEAAADRFAPGAATPV